jgi:hypothetical protein
MFTAAVDSAAKAAAMSLCSSNQVLKKAPLAACLLQVIDEGSLLFGFVAALRKDSSSDSSLSSMC